MKIAPPHRELARRSRNGCNNSQPSD